MQWIGETIESPATGSLDTDLEQGSTRSSRGATSFGYDLLHVLQAIRGGDFSVRMAGDYDGLPGKIAEALDGIVAANQRMVHQLKRVGEDVGREGKTRQRMKFGISNGAWGEMEDSINALIDDLLWPTTAVTRAVAAVARGDLSQTVALEVDGRPLKGEFLQSAAIVNTMMKQLKAFTSEVTRIAREVGTEGKLGGQADAREVTGAWKDLAESVNAMASNLTAQVRNIADVTVAVANGDLSKKLTLDGRGEILQLKDATNTMVDQLRSFVSEVTRVAREVGIEGRLGGQANLCGAAGAWKDLAGNVNLLAANLTAQFRAIAEVAAAVTKGELTRSIQVDARGEIAELKDNINTMIANLRLTAEYNAEQDWLKTNLAKFASTLQGQRDLSSVARLLLSELTPLVDAQLGAIYRMETEEGVPYLKVLAAYADDDGRLYCERIPLGGGLIAQCAIDKRRLLITEMPAYVAPVRLSMFKAVPQNVIVLPILFENQVKAVIELASVSAFTKLQMTFLEQLTASVGIVFNSVEAAMRTEGLLKRLQDSEDRQNLALAAGKMGSWDWDLVKGRCVWDEWQKQIFGVDPASFDVVFPNVRKLVDRGDWKMLCRLLKRVRQDGEACQAEFRLRRPDGGMRWCLGRAVAVRDAGGRISRISGVTMDITERKEAEDRQSLLAREVDHRTKNVLAVVHAIVSLTRAEDIKQFSTAVEGRVQALARAHSLLSESRWCGAKIADLIQGELACYRTPNLERIRISGKSLSLHPSAVQALALAVHELATNAAKHGALSVPSGSVEVTWESRDDQLELRWIERGGPPSEPKAQLGFGMRVIKASVETQLSGTVEFDWGYDGLQCAICVPCRPKMELFDNFWDSIQDSGIRHSNTRELGPRRRIPLVKDESVIGRMLNQSLENSAST
jgi:PAS domain S-box-containing protein